MDYPNQVRKTQAIDNAKFERNLKAVMLYRNSAPNFDGLELYIGDEQAACFNLNQRWLVARHQITRTRFRPTYRAPDEILCRYISRLFYLRTVRSVLILLQEHSELECQLAVSRLNEERQETTVQLSTTNWQIELVFANRPRYQLISAPTKLARFEKYWRWLLLMWIQSDIVNPTVNRNSLLKLRDKYLEENRVLYRADPLLHQLLHQAAYTFFDNSWVQDSTAI